MHSVESKTQSIVAGFGVLSYLCLVLFFGFVGMRAALSEEPSVPRKVEIEKVGSLEYGDATTTPWSTWSLGDPELRQWDTFTIHPEAANMTVPFHIRVEGVWRTETRTAPGVTVVTFRRTR